MAIKTSGTLQMGEIYNEFGGTIPVNLLNYLAGGALVRAGTTGIFGAIPSSPPISIRQFLGASSEGSQLQFAQSFWDNRAQSIRYTDGNSTLSSLYPPTAGYYPYGSTAWDKPEFFGYNHPNTRYTTQFTNTWTHNLSSVTQLSKYFTTITVAAGHLSNGTEGGIIDGGVTASGATLYNNFRYTAIGDGTIPSYPGNQVGGNGYGLSVNLNTYNGNIRNLTSSYSTFVRGGGNYGTWQAQYVIQGRWAWTGTTNFPTNGTFSTVIEPGGMLLHVYERGGNGLSPSMYPNSAVGTFNTAGWDHWWYNGGGGQISVNLTGSNQTHSWTYQDGYGNNYSGALAHTPRTALRLYTY
jgi:hypothetical protein